MPDVSGRENPQTGDPANACQPHRVNCVVVKCTMIRVRIAAKDCDEQDLQGVRERDGACSLRRR